MEWFCAGEGDLLKLASPTSHSGAIFGSLARNATVLRALAALALLDCKGPLFLLACIGSGHAVGAAL